MPQRTALWLSGLLIVAGLSSLSFADDSKAKEKEKAKDFLTTALEHEIIGPRQSLVDTIDYLEPAIPRMPRVASVADWEKEADRMRSVVLKKVIFRGEAAAWGNAKSRVEWLETIEGGPGYRIKKLRYEALPGLWVPALLYEPAELSGKVPVVLNVNGHDGKGKAADYKQVRCINLAKRGILALNIEWFGMGQFADGLNRHDLINHIDLCGSGGIATFYLNMTRGLDALLAHEHADPARVAVTGLSGGGWQTIFVSAFDTRVTLTDPVAGYSSYLTRIRNFSDLGDSEQTPCDLATVTDYALMTAMMAPRPTLLTFNAADNCCFAAPHALQPLLDAALPIFQLYGKPQNLRAHVNYDPGTHNYLRDNREAFYRMVADHFFPGQAINTREIPSDSEVKTPEALKVELPKDNKSLHSVALDLSKSLPIEGELPKDKSAAETWRNDHRDCLRVLVHAKHYNVDAKKTGTEEKDGVKATFWRLKVGPWSVPMVELVQGEPKGTTIVVADAGRKEAGAVAKELLDKNQRVLAVDPFYLGESKIAERDYLFALMVATIGDRALGVQASQLAAIALHDRKGEPVSVVAVGPRSSVIALVAASLDDKAIGALELRGSYGSLKELIEASTSYTASPELFCFGLLREFDILQLAALAAPRPVTFVAPSDRAKQELAGLKAWYKTWGSDREPLK